MTTHPTDPRLTLVSRLSSPPYDGPSGTYCTPLDEAAQLLDAYRGVVYAEVADRLAADAEQGDKEGFTRIYRRSAARKVREWADELSGPPVTDARQPAVDTSEDRCAECGHFRGAHEEAKEPASVGRCTVCAEEDERHNFEAVDEATPVAAPSLPTNEPGPAVAASRADALRESVVVLEELRDMTDVNVAVYPRYDTRQKIALNDAISRLRRMVPADPPGWQQCPNSEFDGYGLQCQKPAGHNLCTFEEEASDV